MEVTGSVVASPVPRDDGASDDVKARIDDLFRRMVAAMLAGWICGLVVAGVLGRIVMRVLAVQSPAYIQGRLTDDQAIVGDISLGGSVTLALIGAFGGASGALGYLLALRILPASTGLRMLIFAIFGATVGGALFVHSYDSFDYSQLDPIEFGVAAFIVLPAVYGAALPPLVTRLSRSDGWIRSRAPVPVLAIASLLLSGFAIVFNAVAIALAFVVQAIEPLRRLWLSRFATIAGVAIFSVLIVLGVTDLAVDISSIRAQEPRTCPICLDD